MRAPACTSRLTSSKKPPTLARISGVQPLLSAWSMAAWAASSSCAHSPWPWPQATRLDQVQHAFLRHALGQAWPALDVDLVSVLAQGEHCAVMRGTAILVVVGSYFSVAQEVAGASQFLSGRRESAASRFD